MSQSLKEIVISALEDVKAENITSLDVRELTGVMDTMVVASGNSNRQVKSLANNVAVEGKNAGFELLGVEGDDTAEWILVDFGDVNVHVMLPATRAFYDLEKLWSVRPGDFHANGDDEQNLLGDLT